ncbi:hypothetical protein NOK64_23780 [Vibrio parahaemolyticus]|uniref:hypothetical protein n=1 Tax=Vibrio parahaemolyticus TaxID=670 RepID=UPI002269F275|nr:hypothetical protein [Vibrio parahaemolyticus]MCX8758854.1 hypothetical protein [Vibrio parahaemolyticus]
MREKKTVDIVFLTGPLAGRTLDIEKDQIADGVLNQIVTHEGNPDDAQTIYRRIKPGTHTINRYDVFLDPKGKSFGYATLKESVFEHQPHDDVFKEQREELNFTASDVLKQREEHRAKDQSIPELEKINFLSNANTAQEIKNHPLFEVFTKDIKNDFFRTAISKQSELERTHKTNMHQVDLSLTDAKSSGTGFLSVTIENGNVIFTHLDSESVEIKSEKK